MLGRFFCIQREMQAAFVQLEVITRAGESVNFYRLPTADPSKIFQTPASDSRLLVKNSIL